MGEKTALSENRKKKPKLLLPIVAALLCVAVIGLVVFGVCNRFANVPGKNSTDEDKPVYRPGASCSVFIYFCGSNLESKQGMAGKDIDELLKADIPENVNVVLETGGAKKWHSHNIANDRLQRYTVKNHELSLIDELPNQSMGDAATFKSFLDWGLKTYPAERDMLIIWDHGGDATNGFCFDENFGFKGLKLSDADAMFGRAEDRKKLDIVMFDTCFMGSIEAVSQMSDYFHYMIASQTIIPGGIFDYSVIAKSFGDNDDEACGRLICDSFMEQCRVKKQDAKASISLFDLSQTDAATNQLDAFFDREIDFIRNDSGQSAMEKSEHGAAWFYSFLAGLSSPIEADNEYNVVDALNFTSGVTTEPEEISKIKTALGGLIAYHIGDVLTYPFPNDDPEYSRALCTGISMYYPVNYKKDDLKAYIANCPVRQYAELLKLLFLQTPETPIEFADKGSINDKGEFEVTLTEESRQGLKEIGCKLWEYYGEGKEPFLLSMDTHEVKSGDKLTFTHDFNGEWYFLCGNRLTGSGVLKEKIFNFTADILCNGELTKYRFSVKRDADNKPIISKGIVGAEYDENGLVNRDFTELKAGDVVNTFSESGMTDSNDSVFTVPSDDITAELNMLEPGRYRCQFIAIDNNDNFVPSDYVIYEITESGGERSVKATKIIKA